MVAPDSIQYKLQSLYGWRRAVTLFICGGLVALAFAPTHLLFLPFISFPCLYITLQACGSKKQAFFTGWWFGFGFFVIGLYWISIALTVDADQFGWLIPFALFGLTGVFALYTGLTGLAFYLFRRNGWRGVVLLATCWTAGEFLRGHLFTGFPWNLLGYVWAYSEVVSQSVSVIGVYGLSFLSVLLFTAPALLFTKEYASPFFATLFIMLLIIISSGIIRLQNETTYVEGVKLRLVQAAIKQELKWDPDHQRETLEKHLNLTNQPGVESVSHVIWSETSMPFPLGAASQWTQILAQHAPKAGGIITGYVRTEGEGKDWKVWNSIALVNADGVTETSYDKHKLVPFGEFIPFRAWIPFKKITHGTADFSRGRGAETLSWKGLPPVSPLVCYEGIFPEEAVNQDNRPDWLLNLTNDAWFGISSGPYQHLQMVRMRAIEQGVPLVRVAGSGISAVIDPYGRILQASKLGESTIIDSPLPVKLLQRTLYSRINDYIILLLVMLGCFATISGKNFNK